MYGWIGKILKVNLTTGETYTVNSDRYVPKYIGARGIAARIAWEEIPPNTDGFDPENRLMFMVGPFVGTPVPNGNRTYVFGVAPQAYPKPIYSRSSFGGNWGSELKFAGYDGIVVWGKSSNPVYLWIDDDEVEIKDASDLWGLDTHSTQRVLMRRHGKESKTVTIGPAGENLVRISVILTETKSTAGQGGYGAVMGSKKLKAITICGTKGVKIAHPKELMELRKQVADLIRPKKEEPEPDHVKLGWVNFPAGSIYKLRRAHNPCVGCVSNCYAWSQFLVDVPGRVRPNMISGQIQCQALWMMVWSTSRSKYAAKTARRDTWINQGVEGGFETVMLANKYGLNIWELCVGIQLWLILCNLKGVMLERDLVDFNPDDPEFWQDLWRKITYRKGIGDILAEGAVRAADNLGRGKEYLRHIAWGQSEHGGGRGAWDFFEFPKWITGALLWATDNRDPFSDTGHKYAVLAGWPNIKQRLEIARRIYGTEEAVLPLHEEVVEGKVKEQQVIESYRGKAQAAIWHQNRGAVIGSLPLCDSAFPLIISECTADSYGDTSLEAKLFVAVTGVEMSEDQLDQRGEMIFNLERAIAVRDGRTRKEDEYVIPFFKEPDWTKGISIDEPRFIKLLDEYYSLRGWDIERGWPRRSKLEQLDLEDVADSLEEMNFPL
jgi:aldehyde:ferredoxin oxidoreductase